MSPSGRRAGTVVAFDEHVGLGQVEAAAGGRRYRFHCTQIAGGSRRIEVGVRVSFELLAGKGGAWEAADLRTAGG